MKIKNGQIYKSREGKRTLEITGKTGRERCWNVRTERGSKNHHIHEGTVKKFYKLLTG